VPGWYGTGVHAQIRRAEQSAGEELWDVVLGTKLCVTPGGSRSTVLIAAEQHNISPLNQIESVCVCGGGGGGLTGLYVGEPRT